ncbi:MAG TPA: cation:proton antiporter [candidate division Zixibacteria bacterium]|nr:cation:proton antiporter [candidate division Zixibacteria bacterium]
MRQQFQQTSNGRFTRIFSGKRNWAIFYGLICYAMFQAQELWAAGGAGAAEVSDVLLGLIVILLAAKLGGDLLERIKQPAVLGELVIGIVLGNLTLLGIDGFEHYKHSVTLEVLAEIGILILLFEVGLESSIREMMSVGLTSFLVAIVGVVAPFFLGFAVSAWFFPQYGLMVDLFIGATLCATSVGITARVLKDINKSRSKEAKIILGAAVIDDILGLVILAVIMGIIQAQDRGGEVSGLDILKVCVKSIGFVFGALALGVWLSPKIFFVAKNMRVSGVLLTVALLFCFALAWAAAQMGLAAIVGAFAAGLILEDIHYQVYPNFKDYTIDDLVAPIATFLVPIFFVRMGMLVSVEHLGNVSVLAFAGALTVAAFIGKQVCGLVVKDKTVNRLAVGLGMVPRGEVGLIFAGIGASMTLAGEPVISPAVYSAVVIMVMVTTLVTPPALQWSLQRTDSPGGNPEQPAGTGSADARTERTSG